MEISPVDATGTMEVTFADPAFEKQYMELLATVLRTKTDEVALAAVMTEYKRVYLKLQTTNPRVDAKKLLASTAGMLADAYEDVTAAVTEATSAIE